MNCPVWLLSFLIVFFFARATNAQFCTPQNVQANFGSGSNVPQQPCVPPLAYDQSSIWLVWNKPDSYSAATVVDYNVYMNGERLGSAAANAAKHSAAAPYIDYFFNQDKVGYHDQVTFHSFLATGLTPNTTYNFTIRSVGCDGDESVDSAILSAKTAPVFAKTVNIVDFGAKADNATVNTDAVQRAIANCSSGSTSAYGCNLILPPGIFVTGTLKIASNMTVEICTGAVLRSSTDPSDLAPNGTLSALLTANNARNIRITGFGTIDGSGWLLDSTIVDELGNQLPVYAKANASTVSQLGVLAKNQVEAAGGGTAGYSSRSTLISLSKITNLFIGNIQAQNPSKDTIKIQNSVNITLVNVRLKTYNANNGDGVGFSSSQNAVAFNNFFNTGDDCLATNAGQGAAGQQSRNPVQYLWIFNNYFREGHGAFVVGSQTAAWMQDILVEDNVLFLTDNGLRMKSTPSTGGGARRIVFRDTAMLGVGVMEGVVTLGVRQFPISQTDIGGQYTQSPFIFTLAYSAGVATSAAANASAQFRDVLVQRVSVDNGRNGQGGSMIAVDAYDGLDKSLPYPESFHQNFTFLDVRFTNVSPANISRLADSTFQDVTITNWGNASSPWMINNSANLTFINVYPKPTGF